MRKLFLVLSIVLMGLTLILGLGAANRADAQERHEKSERQCSNIGIVTDFADNSLYLLDPGTNTLSGPYLKGELGEGNSAINTAVTPGGETAVITSSNSYAIFFVRLPHRSGAPPILLDSVNIGYNAGDAAITPDGTFALIAYAGSDPFIAVLDMETRSLRTTYEIPSTMKISGIEIAANGGTVLAADRTNSKIHVLMLDGDGNLTYTHSIALTFQPGSIAVSPGGFTAVVVNPANGSPAFLRIETPGNAVLVEENIPIQCPHGVSAVFSNNGSKVYYLSNNGTGTYIRLLDVPAPGILTSSSRGIDVSHQSAKGETPFDSITIEPTGRYAYVWRKVSQLGNPAGIAVIDLTTQKLVKTLGGVDFPVEITFGCPTTPAAPSKPASDQSPFGSFETPANGSTVRSSIAVTGWALDDDGVESVKIYRQQGSSLVYIGDALFIEGARPDVAAAYPNYPNNTRAGWGYMMLTYFLPNGGNGTFKIHAIAKDTAGHEKTLGIKTIRCDNAHATKPFGAIDTPQPGATISGTNYKITGWALTPPPHKIPVNGSTIRVFINGQNIGNVTYNIYRSDIATFFPGYANSNGAHGYINIDTTRYDDGVHTLEWLVTDNAGNTDGVGSRFFTIENDDEEYDYTTTVTTVETQNIDAYWGGTIEVTDPDSLIEGVKLEIPFGALSQDTVISVGRVNNPLARLPSGLNFVGPPIDLKPDGITFNSAVSIEISYTDEQLSDAGVSDDSALKLCYYNEDSNEWEKVNITSIDTVNNKIIAEITHFSSYAVTGLSSTPPLDVGTPQPGDLIFKKSQYKIINKTVRGWIPGHVAIYTGEKEYTGGAASRDVIDLGKYNIVEAQFDGGVVYGYYDIPNAHETDEGSLEAFGNDDKGPYMGAREPGNTTLTPHQRNAIVAYVEDKVGRPYTVAEVAKGIAFGMGNKGKGPQEYNCVGLAEAAYEAAGVNGGNGLVLPSDETRLLTPAEQYNMTKPANGGSGSNPYPTIMWAMIYPNSGTPYTQVLVEVKVKHSSGDLSNIDSVTYVTDNGYTNPNLYINDEGLQGDATPGDGIYSVQATAGGDSSYGSMGLNFTVTDKFNKTHKTRIVYYYTGQDYKNKIDTTGLKTFFIE